MYRDAVRRCSLFVCISKPTDLNVPRLSSFGGLMFTGIATLERAGNDRFTGATSPDRGSQTYGGQLLAQALAAAHATVNDDRRVHSLHAYFLRSGAPEQSLELVVERLRDGRSFSLFE